ncbi:hypothetical protein L3Q82_006026 [Scortum barcoo]|uniref:Uncharacterized protein n=1 Tax=Scortum barcoo TaxID=214431 RepID=A0ACB8X2I4_9TELE|nr:hypothetical protein L3Q82_006026 [Scortum barcoo]
MLEKGVIRESCSPWAAHIVLVKKKHGSWRFCVDYRKLNAVTHKDAFPLPRIEETLTNLTRAKWFSTLDLASGYWQVEMDPQDREKTAFSTPLGLFEFEHMPFGLFNAPATFQRLMQQCLNGQVTESLLVYLDDIIVYSPDFSSHLQCLDEVFQRLWRHGLKLWLDKCKLLQRDVKFLGHVVDPRGIRPDPDKVSAVLDCPALSTVKQTARLGAVEQPWFAQCASFNYNIRYRSGRSNVNAGALSRSPVEAPDTEPVDGAVDGEAVFTAAVELTPGEGGEEWADSEWEEAQASDPDIQEFSWKRQKEDGPLEELPPAEGEQLELRESGRTAAILLIRQPESSTYKYRCYVQHEGGTVEAPTEQELPAPAASCPPEREPADLPALQQADLSFQSQCRVKLLSLLYSVLIVKSLVYCCGLSLLRILRNKGPCLNLDLGPPGDSASPLVSMVERRSCDSDGEGGMGGCRNSLGGEVNLGVVGFWAGTWSSQTHGNNNTLRQEITLLGQEINGKLDRLGTEVRNLSDRVEEAESRVETVERWAAETTEVLSSCLKQQKALQHKLNDIESRSRRNNIRIFGVAEGEEGEDSVPEFVEALIRSRLSIPGGMELNIQRTHRSGPHRPTPDKPSRAFIITFQEFTTKEWVLKEAWKKKEGKDPAE